MHPESFFSFTIGNLATVIGVIIAYVKLHKDQRKSHDDNIEKQAKMHLDNQYQLKRLGEFHENQLEVNKRRDRQIDELEKQTSELGKQTAVLTNIAENIQKQVDKLDTKLDSRSGDRRQHPRS